MREIIIISRCQRIKRHNALEQLGEFHFKGVYSGEMIKRIFLIIPLNQTIEINEEYVLHVQLFYIREDYLMGKIIRAKNLALCFQQD